MGITMAAVQDVLLFQGMPPEDVAALVAEAQEAEVGANVVVVKEGESGEAFYVILAGAVAITKALDQGRVELLNVLTHGDYFGELALLNAAARSASVTTLEPTRLMVITAKTFEHFTAAHPAGSAALFRVFSRTMGERLRYLTEKLRGVAERGAHIQEDVQRMQSELMGIVARELRTPVTVLKGTTDLLTEVAMGPERRKRFLHTMETQAAHLTRLLTDINQLVELQYRTAPLKKQPMQLQGILQEALEELQPALDWRGIQFVAQIPADLPPVPVAPEKIHKVLVHLLDNGIKYNRDRGTLTMTARTVNGARVMIEVAVKDTGPGMPKEVEERVFAVGGTAGPTIQREPGSFGVGLALARKLIEAHGGRLWMESALGEGTTFYFTLPL